MACAATASANSDAVPRLPQYDVHLNVDDASGQVPYLLDVQANLLADLPTRVAVPLVRADAFARPAARLHPPFTIAGHHLVMATHLLAAVRRQTLGTTVACLLDQRDVVISAIDVLWSAV
jgi:toxin CcdB